MLEKENHYIWVHLKYLFIKKKIDVDSVLYYTALSLIYSNWRVCIDNLTR